VIKNLIDNILYKIAFFFFLVYNDDQFTETTIVYTEKRGMVCEQSHKFSFRALRSSP
jgi:hypothetical protein